jgi:hypothetical protein
VAGVIDEDIDRFERFRNKLRQSVDPGSIGHINVDRTDRLAKLGSERLQ